MKSNIRSRAKDVTALLSGRRQASLGFATDQTQGALGSLSKIVPFRLVQAELSISGLQFIFLLSLDCTKAHLRKTTFSLLLHFALRLDCSECPECLLFGIIQSVESPMLLLK